MSKRSEYTREAISQLRGKYEEGTRVELVSLFDPLRCPKLNVGEVRTVSYVSDTGIIAVDWDCGISLEVVYDEDVIRVFNGWMESDVVNGNG